MAKIELKKPVVEEISAGIKDAQSVVLVDYRGLTVEQDTELRKQLREAGVVYKVYKNKLFQKACEELGITGFDAYLEGTTAFAFGMEDETCAPRIIKNQIKALNKLEIKAGFLNGEVVDKAQVEKLASIPSKEQLIANLLAMLNAPVSALARAIQAIADKQN